MNKDSKNKLMVNSCAIGDYQKSIFQTITFLSSLAESRLFSCQASLLIESACEA
jgi:hypothetical protein